MRLEGFVLLRCCCCSAVLRPGQGAQIYGNSAKQVCLSGRQPQLDMGGHGRVLTNADAVTGAVMCLRT